jgi:hypothetical protein
MENNKSLKARALIRQATDLVHAKINLLFANGIMTASIIVGSVFLASDELIRMKQLSISSSPYLI